MRPNKRLKLTCHRSPLSTCVTLWRRNQAVPAAPSAGDTQLSREPLGRNMRMLSMRVSTMITMFILGCTTPALEAPFVYEIDPDLPQEVQSCFNQAAVRAYFQDIHGRVMKRWAIPRGTPPDHRVDVRFRIAPSGELLFAKVTSSTSEKLAASVLRAVNDAVPFPGVPDEAICITNYDLIAHFWNPESSQLRH